MIILDRLLTAAGTLAAVLTAGVLLAVPAHPGPGHPAAARAVRALVSEPPEVALQAVPDDFADVLGYQPVVRDGRLERPDGECSSPVALPERFEPVCREHDLGYDLLRYAARQGRPLGTWARDALDVRFGRELLATCPADELLGAPTCSATAHLAATAVEINSARQLDGPPGETPASRVLTTAGAVGLAAAAGALVVRRRTG